MTKEFKCELCEYKSSRKYNLKKHIKQEKNPNGTETSFFFF